MLAISDLFRNFAAVCGWHPFLLVIMLDWVQGNLFSPEVWAGLSVQPEIRKKRNVGTHSARILGVSRRFLIKDAKLCGKYDIPSLLPCRTGAVPSMVLPFSKAFSQRRVVGGLLHCFEEDYKIERLWTNVRRYLPFLRQFTYIIGPDFSMRIGSPVAEQIHNLYRNHALAWWMQRMGLPVIAPACWSDAASFDWCFDGMPNGGTVAVSTIGAMGNPLTRQAFMRGLRAMFQHVTPDCVWLVGYHRNKEAEAYLASKCETIFINANYHGKQGCIC